VIGIGTAIPLAELYGISGIALGWLAGSATVGIASIPRLVRTLRTDASSD
jgi:hypothetical protein